MGDQGKEYEAHILAIPFQSPGHVNPMLQLCKRLVSKGMKATLAITKFLSKSMHPKSGTVQIEVISDGYDEGGFFVVDSVAASVARYKEVGSESVAQLIRKYESMGHPIDCVIYDSLLPWFVDVPKKFGLVGVAFFTQQCAVNYIMYHFYHGTIKFPVTSSPVVLPGLPSFDLRDLPTFDANPDHFDLLASQLSTVHKADYVLVNTFYKLEEEVVNSMSNVCPLMTIGPTIPSFYLDNRVQNDKEYGLSPSNLDHSTCLNWLNTKPDRSVVYVSFSSIGLGSPGEKQMEELAWGIKGSNCCFLWVVKAFEAEKLPKGFAEETADKGLIVEWSPQLEVLSNKAVGCIFSHCGWNSTIEALSLGVPILAMPQWADQTTNAKFIQDVWKVGKRVDIGEKGIAGREKIEGCIKEVMEGETGKRMKENAQKWSSFAKEAVSEGGTSDKNLNEFVSKLKEFSSSRH